MIFFWLNLIYFKWFYFCLYSYPKSNLKYFGSYSSCSFDCECNLYHGLQNVAWRIGLFYLYNTMKVCFFLHNHGEWYCILRTDLFIKWLNEFHHSWRYCFLMVNLVFLGLLYSSMYCDTKGSYVFALFLIKLIVW